MCGGSGSRLWPLSRQTLPKPFVALPGRESTLIDDTYARLCGSELPLAAVVTVTAADYAFLCARHFRASGPAGVQHLIIAEPVGRNTAAAIAVATELVVQRFGEDARITVLSADQEMHNAATFRRVLHAAATASGEAADGITLVGIPPTYPATAYGYIQYESDGTDDGAPLARVTRFTEKPDAATAAQFVASGNYYWNAGIFCYAAAVGRQRIAAHCPDIAAALTDIFPSDNETTRGEAGSEASESGGEELLHPDSATYHRFPAISFDYAVMEKTQPVYVADGGDCGWRDVGSWQSVAELMPADASGNRSTGAVHLHGCEDTLAVAAPTRRLLVGIGLKNLHIVDTPDALLVAASDQSAPLSEVFKTLLAQKNEAVLTPATVKKPWGSYTVIGEGRGEGGLQYKIKRIDVAAGEQLSLQSHQHRSEHWTTVAGVMRVEVGERAFDMPVNESCFIPQQAKHRMQNCSDSPAAVVEVQVGSYLGEDDITRYEDRYNRA